MTAKNNGRKEAELDLLTYLVHSPHEIADFDGKTLGKPFTDKSIREAYEAMAEVVEPTYEVVLQTVQESGSEVWSHLCKAKPKHGSLQEALKDFERYAEPDELTDTDPDQWQPRILTMSDVQPKRIEWLWEGRLALGRLSLLAGRPGLGKSFLTCDIAARVSTGRAFPDDQPCKAGDVLILNSEDDTQDTICPRLMAHEANMSRVHVLDGQYQSGSDEADRIVTLQDLATIENSIRCCPELRLIVVDPVGSFIGGKTDAHRDNEVRSVLAPICKLAESHNVAVLIVAHPNKSAGKYADDSILGSRAFTGIVRSVWHMARDPDDSERRLLLPGKNNLGPNESGLAFTIQPQEVRTDAGIVINSGRLGWEDEPVNKTADEHFAEAANRNSQPRKLTPAEKWLEDWLIEPTRQTVIVRSGKLAGFSERTLQRACNQLGLAKSREGQSGPVLWHPVKELIETP